MGLTKVTNSPGLSIHLDDPRPVYRPGDVIRGQVSLHTTSDCAIGAVVVSFWGRAKTKIVQQNGQSASVYRGRTRYFSVDRTLYTGQYTHKPGSFSWPFELTVPDRADPQCILSGQKWKPKDHFQTNTDVDGLDLTLPPTTFNSRYQARKVDCFVEYVLEASLTEPQDAHRFRGPKTKTSTLPVTFQPLPTPEPIRTFDLVTDRPPQLVTISTLKLLPEHAGTNLGLRDRARSLFQRDSIPRFSFTLTVRAPTTIQTFHPAPLPFILSVEPDLDNPNTTTIDASSASSCPVVTLRSLRVDLKTHVRCRAVATYADDKTYEVSLLNLKQLNQKLLPLDSKGTKTFSDSIPSSSTSKTIDLGSLYDLRVGNATLGSRLESPLCPSFTSYNVSREYFLVWEIEVECAEKTEKCSSTKQGTPCRVLLPPATARMDGFDTAANNHLVMALESSRLSTEGDGGGTPRGTTRRSTEKEKPGFFTSDDKTRLDHHHKTKAREAAEEEQQERHDDDQDQRCHQEPADLNSSLGPDVPSRRGAPEVYYSRGQPPPPPQYVP